MNMNIQTPDEIVSDRPAVGAGGCCAPSLDTMDPGALSELVAITRAIADPVRLQVLDMLRGRPGEVCVCELQALLPISQPTLSHHLRRLREAGLVGVERRKQWMYYYVIPEKMEVLKAWLT